MGVEALAGHLRRGDIPVGARTQEQLAVLDHEQLLTCLCWNRRRTPQLDRTSAADNLELLAARTDHGLLARGGCRPAAVLP